MKKSARTLLAAALVAGILSLQGCGYNAMQAQDEAIKAQWSEVLNQYTRRADLVPNLVTAVKGYAAHEQEVFMAVTKARTNVGQIQMPAGAATDAASIDRYQKAQAELSGALNKLIAVSEAYPNLKADANFRDLQAQLEGTENRVSVARNRYIKAVEQYNTTVRSFPSNLTAMVFGMQIKPNFVVENEKEISAPPKIDFGAPAAPVVAK